MTAIQAADYIFENLDEFKATHTEDIEKFEALGIDRTTALSMVITLAANAKALTDALSA